MIEKTAANRVVLLSGNVHFAEISRVEDGSLTEFTANGMTHVNKTYAQAPNRFRITGPYVDHHFGLVENDWRRSSPRITLKVINRLGDVVLSHKVIFEE